MSEIAPSGAEEGVPMIAAGERAPRIEAPDQDGRPVRLSDYEGRRVVLYFYPKDHTAGCANQAAGFNGRLGEIEALGARLLGVSRDSVRSHARFAADLGLRFPILSDPDLSALNAYGVVGEKKMYGKTVTGVLRTTLVIGPDGIVEKVFEKVRPADSAGDVIEYLASHPA